MGARSARTWQVQWLVVAFLCSTADAAVAETRSFAYVFARNYLSIVDTQSGETKETILTRRSFFGGVGDVVFSPDGSVAYLLDSILPGIRSLDARTGQLGTPLTVPGIGLPLERGVISPDGRWLYATSEDLLLSIDPTTGRTRAGICVGRDAYDVDVTPNGRKAYVTTNVHDERGSFVVAVDLESGVVQAEIAMPAATRNLAVSPDGRSVYVATAFAGSFIIDTTTDEVTGAIEGAAPRDIVFSPDGSFAYAVDWGAEPVVAVIDTKTRSVVGSIGIPAHGERLAITPDGDLLYVIHRRACSVSVVDVRKRVFAGSVDFLEASGVAFTSIEREVPPPTPTRSSFRGAGKAPSECAYVSFPHSDLVSVIDLSTREVIGGIPVRGSGQFVGASRSLLYVNGRTNLDTAGALTAIDTTVNEVVGEVPLERGTGAGVDLAGDGSFALLASPTACSRLAKVDTATSDVTYFLPPEPDESGVWGVAISPTDRFAYVASFKDAPLFRILIVDLETLVLVGEIPFPERRPGRIVFTPDGRFAYVSAQQFREDSPFTSHGEPGFVIVVDATSHSIVDEIPVQNSPSALAVSPDGTCMYVINRDSDSISVIDTTTNEVRATIPVGSSPSSLAVSPNGRSVYVASSLPPNLSVIDSESDLVIDTIPLPLTPPEDVTIQEVPGGCAVPPPPPSPTPSILIPCTCDGDCDCNGRTSIDELLLATSIALGEAPLASCHAADWNHDDHVSIEELIEAVNTAIEGCLRLSCGL